MVATYLRKGSTLFAIREMQVKMSLRFCLMKIRMAIIKKKAVSDVGKGESLPTACEDVN